MIYQFGVVCLVGTCMSMTLVQPSCLCTREVQLVCGNDGQTYSNPCILNCAKQVIKNLHINYRGPCVAEQQQLPPCWCPKIKKPVCASNGVTYDNECLMRCAVAELKVIMDEPCDTD